MAVRVSFEHILSVVEDPCLEGLVQLRSKEEVTKVVSVRKNGRKKQ